MTTVSSVTESLFQRGSQYQQFRPTYPPSLFQWLSNQSTGHHLALDLGCGSGQASRGLITVAQAYHWFDQAAFHAEAQRTLCPGGMLALISYGVCEVTGLGSMIQDFHDGPLAPWWPPERAQVVAGYPDADLPWPALTYPGDCITLDWSATDMLGYLDTWSALVQAARTGEHPLDDFAPTLRQAWGDGLRTVHWPLRVRAWRKQ
jgi:hypothetical protein